MKRRDARSVLKVPFVKILAEDHAQDLLERFSVKAAVQDPTVRLSISDLQARPLLLYKISIRGLLARSLYKNSVQDLFKSSLSTDLLKKSLGKTSGQNV